MPFGLGLGGTGFGLAPTKTIRTYGRRGGQHRTVAAMPMRETLSAFQELSVDSPESSVEVPDQKVSEDTPKLSVDLSLDEENAASLSNADFGVVNGKTVAVGKKAAKTTPKMKAAPRKPATKKTTQKVTVNSAPKTDKEVGDNLDVVTEPLPVSRSRRTAPKIIIHEDVDDSRSSSSAPSISAIPSDKSTSSAVDASTSPLFDDSKLTQKSPETPSWKSTFDISPVAASTPVGFALSALTSTHSRRISFPKSPDSSLSAVHVADFKSNEVTDKLQMPEQRTPQCTGETSILERSFRRLSLSGRKVAVDRRRTIAPESLQVIERCQGRCDCTLMYFHCI